MIPAAAKFPIKVCLAKLLKPYVFTHHVFQWKGTSDKSMKCKCFLRKKGLKNSTVLAIINSLWPFHNPVSFCLKMMAIPECADMATVAMATELGHTSM